jgi:hypothetical protein
MTLKEKTDLDHVLILSGKKPKLRGSLKSKFCSSIDQKLDACDKDNPRSVIETMEPTLRSLIFVSLYHGGHHQWFALFYAGCYPSSLYYYAARATVVTRCNRTLIHAEWIIVVMRSSWSQVLFTSWQRAIRLVKPSSLQSWTPSILLPIISPILGGRAKIFMNGSESLCW